MGFNVVLGGYMSTKRVAESVDMNLWLPDSVAASVELCTAPTTGSHPSACSPVPTCSLVHPSLQSPKHPSLPHALNLPPSAPQPAALCTPACSPLHPSLQPLHPSLQLSAPQPAALCTPACRALHPSLPPSAPQAILRIFRDDGERKDRQKGRLMWLVESYGPVVQVAHY